MGKRGPQPKFTDKEKWCNRCKKWLPLGDFGGNKNTASGKAYYCKGCHNSYCRGFWTNVQAYEHILMRDFGLTPTAYLTFWREQNHGCAICGSELTLYNRGTQVDYDPATKKVRGLLCANCHEGLGKFKNLVGLIRKAAQYLTVEVVDAPAS